MRNNKREPFSGTITARNCPTCGHHEIGLVSEDGVFRPLKTGTRVIIMDEMDPAQMPGSREAHPVIGEPVEKPLEIPKGRFWVPEPLKGDRRMRMKYGVIIPEQMASDPVSGPIYESAYLQKLQFLLEKEIHVPIAVILDRFFVAPHLASGEPRDMVVRMWEELEEIRRPVEQVTEWLEEPNEESLRLLIQPDVMEKLESAPISSKEALEELRALDLEDFLALL
jgi:hypothetical protein